MRSMDLVGGVLGCLMGVAVSASAQLPKLAPGEPVTATTVNAIIDAVNGVKTGLWRNLELPNTTSMQGQIRMSGAPFLHSYGTMNLFLGQSAGNFTMTGSSNLAIGYLTLASNNTGGLNTATGHLALTDNITGSKNTASGYFALLENTHGYDNTATGNHALRMSTIGFQNTATGSQALQWLTVGWGNAAVGYQAGAELTTGDYNIFLGQDAQPSHPDAYNQIVIGVNTTGTGDNEIALGNADITAIKAQVTAITGYSDGRLKRDVTGSPLGLAFIKALRPVRYRWKNPADYPAPLLEPRFHDASTPRPADNDMRYDGFIAQEVKAALDTLGQEWSGWSANDTTGKQGILYGALTVPLVRAVQELDAALEERDAVIAKQQRQLDMLLTRLTALEQQRTE